MRVLNEHHVEVRASNHELYQAISDRIIDMMREMVPTIERYSINEVFADLSGMHETPEDATALGQTLRTRLWKWLLMPSCVGIAPAFLPTAGNMVLVQTKGGTSYVHDFVLHTADTMTT